MCGPTPPAETVVDAPWTERRLLDLLRDRHARQVKGNGPVWVHMEHVADASGFGASRRIDALAMHLWPSRHHDVHAFEVKVSRSDFRRELADGCAKSAVWRAWVEYFWIVAASRSVVPLDELPAGWGLMVPMGNGLVVVRQARRLRPAPQGYLPAPDMPRAIVACMLRQAARLADATVDS